MLKSYRELESENLIFRQLLFGAHSRGLGYGDDGELQDCTKWPYIDWKRDSAGEIQHKLLARMYADPGVQEEIGKLREILVDEKTGMLSPEIK